MKWSYEEQRRLVEIAASSKSLEEIVDRTGRTSKSIRNMALQLGVSLKFDRAKSKAKGK